MRTILPQDAKLIPEKATKVFSGVIYDVYHWNQEMFDGTYETFEMLKRPDTVVVIVLNDKGEILISDEEQPHAGRFYGLPGGRHDNSEEDELAAAKRELREETGLVCSHWKLLQAKQSSKKFEHFVYTFLARDICEEHEQNLDAGEKIVPLWKNLSDVQNLMKQDTFPYPAELLEEATSIQDVMSMPDMLS